MKKIIIIGSPGAGKTTFAVKLSEKLKLPLVHLDKIYWYGDWQHITRAEFDSLLQTELEKEKWIIDGNFTRTIPVRLKYCDTVFFFDVSPITALMGLAKRVITNHGKTRPDMGGNCPEHFDRDLFLDALTFKRKNGRNHYKMLKNTNANIIIFKSRKQAERYLNSL